MGYPEYKTDKTYNWQLSSNKIEKTAFYNHDLTISTVVEVNTLKGIIELDNMETIGSALPEFDGAVQIYINNPSLNLTEANKDNIYVQLTPYYKPAALDKAIPYLLANGVVVPNGLGVEIYNASPAAASPNQWEGALYIYYEIYTIK
jgi:hypothetical protein